LLTPIAKAWSTDVAVEVSSLAVQVHGGVGFVEESGAPQHYRDARIAPIYEGTNGIQAMDLVGRKLTGDGGAAMGVLLDDMHETAEDMALSSNVELPPIAARLSTAVAALRTATDWMLDPSTPQIDRLSGATAYLKLAGDVVGGYFLSVGAVAGQRLLKDDENDAYAQSKVDLARFYAETVLSAAAGQVDGVCAGADVVFDVPVEMLG